MSFESKFRFEVSLRGERITITTCPIQQIERNSKSSAAGISQRSGSRCLVGVVLFGDGVCVIIRYQ